MRRKYQNSNPFNTRHLYLIHIKSHIFIQNLIERVHSGASPSVSLPEISPCSATSHCDLLNYFMNRQLLYRAEHSLVMLWNVRTPFSVHFSTPISPKPCRPAPWSNEAVCPHACACMCAHACVFMHMRAYLSDYACVSRDGNECVYVICPCPLCVTLYMWTCVCVHVYVPNCGVTVIPVHLPASSSHGQLWGTLPAGTPTEEN